MTSQKFESPYLEHRAFKIDVSEKPWILSSTYGFNEIYSQLKTGTADLSDSAKEDLKNACLNSFYQIFRELEQQADLEREKLFVSDLESHATRILKEDIGVFLKRNAKPVSAGNATANSAYEHFTKQKFLQNRLSKESVNEINRLIGDTVREFRKRASEGKTTREDLSINTGSLVKQVVGILNSEFEKNNILNLLSDYMGEDVCVTGVAVELSVPNANWWKVDYSVYDRQPNTLYFHFDESLAHPKSIVYLNDVDETNGATSCAPAFLYNTDVSDLQFLIGRSIACVGKEKNSRLRSFYNHVYHQTFGCDIFKRDFSKLPGEMKFSSHFGWDIIPDSPLEQFVAKDEKKIIGEAGTYIVFDGGYLAHRGGLILTGERIALQVIFGRRESLLEKVVRKLKQYKK